EVQNTVVVTYPDGSQDEVPVKVVVTKAPEKEKPDAEKYAPQGQEVTTMQGQMPQAKAGVSNKADLPKDTKYAWKTPLNVTQSGEQQDTVVVTYPDSSQDEVPVKVVVTKTPEKETDAEKYVPQCQNVRTVQDKMPRAEAGVSNKSELPKGTKYSWKTPLDVSTLGKHQGTVVVTYPDSSQAEVSVTVEVDVWKNGAKTMRVNNLMSKPKTDKGNADKNAHMLKESLPQTGEDNEKKTLFVGTLLTLVAGMLGSELLNKKHTKDQK
ncbi:MAG: LPXTG cell wall anchor domain-containing protein, partial [Ligilactobacillus sp.]|nr:LPXTG cell wall anchor domain-containing protein [Ligilactobacillus sp.]